MDKEKNRELVLIVDDDPGITGFVGPALENEGYKVAVFTGTNASFEAFKKAEGKKPPLDISPKVAVLDLVMAYMNGVELGERLSQIFPGMGILYLSAIPENVIKAEPRSPYKLLGKPFDLEVLIDKVKSMDGKGSESPENILHHPRLDLTGQRPIVQIVDDDYALACIWGEAMQESGYEVWVDTNPRQGLDKINKEFKNGKLPHAGFVDWDLRDEINGIRFIRMAQDKMYRLTGIPNFTRYALTSGYPFNRFGQELLALKLEGLADRFLFKGNLVGLIEAVQCADTLVSQSSRKFARVSSGLLVPSAA